MMRLENKKLNSIQIKTILRKLEFNYLKHLRNGKPLNETPFTGHVLETVQRRILQKLTDRGPQLAGVHRHLQHHRE